MQPTWKEALSRRFGAAIDMLENAVRAYPDEVWSDTDPQPQLWYLVYHPLLPATLPLEVQQDDRFAPSGDGFSALRVFVGGVDFGELLLYNLRHVQHSAGQPEPDPATERRFSSELGGTDLLDTGSRVWYNTDEIFFISRLKCRCAAS